MVIKTFKTRDERCEIHIHLINTLTYAIERGNTLWPVYTELFDISMRIYTVYFCHLNRMLHERVY